MRPLLLAIPLLLSSACGSDHAPTSSTAPVTTPATMPARAISAAQLAQIDEYVEAQMARRHLPGVALVVTIGGKPVLEKGYGLANTASGAKVTPDSVFQIGSVTKQFTACA
ncbi:MAG: serine hydrolase domain-containing protein, partial [Gammaproteobacteria bacterium]